MASTKKQKPSEGKSSKEGAVVAAEFEASSWLGRSFGKASVLAHKHKKLATIALLSVVVVILGSVVLLNKQPETPPRDIAINPNQSVGAQVSGMDSADLDDLAESDVSAKDNIAKAHAKALALVQLGKYGDAIGVYKDIVATGNADYSIYVDYALAYAQAEDFTKAASTMQTALDKLESDPNVSGEEKAAQKNSMDSKIDGFKYEAEKS